MDTIQPQWLTYSQGVFNPSTPLSPKPKPGTFHKEIQLPLQFEVHPSSTTLASVGELPHVVPSELPKLFKLPVSALVTRNNKHQGCRIEFLKYKAYFIFHNSETLSLILFGVVEPSLGEQQNLLVNESLFANSKEKKIQYISKRPGK